MNGISPARLSGRTLRELANTITGDGKLTPYRSGPDLVTLFNDFGANDAYGPGFPSRRSYAEEKIRATFGTALFPKLITHIFDPREFIGGTHDPLKAVEHMNQFFKFDGLQIVKEGEFFKLRDVSGASIEFASPFKGSAKVSHVFIDEQLAKCDEKLGREDYDGAITNARSLIEAVLIEIEHDFDANAKSYDGDLPKLYRRVQKHLSLDPARPDIGDTLKQILSGLTSIVSGLAGMRNKMSDAHAQSYRPRKHHAKLAVNAAKTLANFIFDTRQHQSERGGKKRPNPS
jgi:hypothetical protein